MRRPSVLGFMLIVFLVAAAVLSVVVLALGNRSDRLELASAVAGGLVVAAAVTFWEHSRRQREDVERSARRRALQDTLTSYVGSELGLIGFAANITGFAGSDDPDKWPLLFEDHAASMNLDSYAVVELVRERISQLAVNQQGEEPLDIRTLIDVIHARVRGFYERLDRHLDVMLSFFIEVGDVRTTDALLGLGAARANYERESDASGNLMIARNESVTAEEMRKREARHLQSSEGVLTAYAELLRAIEGAESAEAIDTDG